MAPIRIEGTKHARCESDDLVTRLACLRCVVTAVTDRAQRVWWCGPCARFIASETSGFFKAQTRGWTAAGVFAPYVTAKSDVVPYVELRMNASYNLVMVPEWSNALLDAGRVLRMRSSRPATKEMLDWPLVLNAAYRDLELRRALLSLCELASPQEMFAWIAANGPSGVVRKPKTRKARARDE